MIPCSHNLVPYDRPPLIGDQLFVCPLCAIVYMAVDVDAVRFFIPLRNVGGILHASLQG